MGKFKKIVLNVPHASIEGLCNSKLSYWNLSSSFFNDCILKWTDWYTDYLFNENNNFIEMVRFPLSRFIIDAERLLHDPMEEIGQGIVYTDFGNFHRSFPPNKNSIFRVLLMKWQEHQRNLISKLSVDALLMDCHSFPGDFSDIDVCIGYNEDWSKPDRETLDTIADTFTSFGYKVSINSPYSNSITPQAKFKYKSVMIEINKRIYLQDEHASLLLDASKTSTFKDSIRDLYRKLL
jgi:N-formylglutamate amidohydrolase